MIGLLKDIFNHAPLQPVQGSVVSRFGSREALRVESAYSWGAAQTAVVGVSRGRIRTGERVVVPGVGPVRVNFVEDRHGPVEAVRSGQSVEVKLIGVHPAQLPVGTMLFRAQ